MAIIIGRCLRHIEIRVFIWFDFGFNPWKVFSLEKKLPSLKQFAPTFAFACPYPDCQSCKKGYAANCIYVASARCQTGNWLNRYIEFTYLCTFTAPLSLITFKKNSVFAMLCHRVNLFFRGSGGGEWKNACVIQFLKRGAPRSGNFSPVQYSPGFYR